MTFPLQREEGKQIYHSLFEELGTQLWKKGEMDGGVEGGRATQEYTTGNKKDKEEKRYREFYREVKKLAEVIAVRKR